MKRYQLVFLVISSGYQTLVKLDLVYLYLYSKRKKVFPFALINGDSPSIYALLSLKKKKNLPCTNPPQKINNKVQKLLVLAHKFPIKINSGLQVIRRTYPLAEQTSVVFLNLSNTQRPTEIFMINREVSVNVNFEFRYENLYRSLVYGNFNINKFIHLFLEWILCQF